MTRTHRSSSNGSRLLRTHDCESDCIEALDALNDGRDTFDAPPVSS